MYQDDFYPDQYKMKTLPLIYTHTLNVFCLQYKVHSDTKCSQLAKNKEVKSQFRSMQSKQLEFNLIVSIARGNLECNSSYNPQDKFSPSALAWGGKIIQAVWTGNKDFYEVTQMVLNCLDAAGKSLIINCKKII